MIRSRAISLMLAWAVLASALACALPKDPRRNEKSHNNAPRNNPARNNSPRIPNAPRNQDKIEGIKPESPHIVEPRHVEEPKLPRISEPRAGEAKVPRVNEQQQPRPGEGLNRLKDLSLADQQKALNNDPDFQRLPPKRKQELQKRLDEFNHLPPEQKQRLIERMREWEKLTPQQQDQARGLQEKLRDVPAERRKMMQTALRNLRNMDPQERQRVLNSDRFRSMFNDNERSIMGGLADLPIGRNPQPQPEGQQAAPQSSAK